MVILAAGMAGLGYVGIQTASDGYQNYRLDARMNVAISDMMTNLIQSVSKTYDYLSSGDAALIADAQKDLDEFSSIAEQSGAEAKAEYRKKPSLN